MKLTILTTCFFLLFSPVLAANDSATSKAAKETVLLGVFPYLSPRELEKMYSPIAAKLGETLGRNVQFMTSSTYQKFMANLDKQMYDIVFVQPFDYVAIADKFGYRPLATRNEKLPAIVVVKQDSKIQSVSELRGKTVTLPPPVAAISYMTKDYFGSNGLDVTNDVTLKHQRSHASCMRSVLIGAADACGTAPPALRFFENKMKTKLKVIAKTDGIPNSLFAVHPRVKDSDFEKLKVEVLSWPKTEKGKILLKGAKVNQFVYVKDKKYDVVRKMAKTYRR